MGKEDHSMTFLLLALYFWITPSWLKVVGGWWVAHVIIVSAPAQIIGFLGFLD